MKRLFLLTSAWLLLFSAFVFIFAGKSAKAAQDIDITWIDASHIDVKFKFDREKASNGKIYSGFSTQQGVYKFSAFNNGFLTYTLGGGKPVECVSEVRFAASGDKSMFAAADRAHDIKLWVKDPRSSGGNCRLWEQDDRLPAKNQNNSRIFFEWVDAGSIKTVGKVPYFVIGGLTGFSGKDSRKIKDFGIFSFNKDLGDFQETANSTCKSYVDSFNTEKTQATFHAWNSGKEDDCNDIEYTEIKGIRLASAQNATLPAGTGTPKEEAGGDLQAGESEPTCEGQFLDEPLSWVTCGIIRSLNKVIVAFDNAIFNELKVRESDFDRTNDAAGKQYYEIWSVMRYLAMAFVVIIGLIMVISQAIGEGPFDAYSIKKVMPRLLIAIIAISLSWELMNLVIRLVNDIGFGVRALIYTPFGGASAVDVPFDLSAPERTAGLGIGLLLGGVAIFGGVGSGVLLSLVVTAALAVLIGFAVIIFRKILIAMLVITAPIAIICSVLPNTQKVWKVWNESFSKALLMFPLIMAFLATGRVFSYVSERGDTQNLLQQIVSIFAYFAPYFLIPATFKFAGGVISSVAGMTDKSRGAFDRLKKGRQNMMARKREDLKAGNRFKGQNVFSRRASRALQTATLAPQGGLTLDMAKRRARVATARGARTFDLATEFLEKSNAARPIKADDDKLWAVQYGNDEEGVRAELIKRAPGRFDGVTNRTALDEATAEVMRFKREAGDNVGRVAATIAQAGTGTGYNYKYNDETDDMLTAIIRASGDDRSLGGRMLATMRPMASQSGRIDLAGGGYAKQAQTMDKLRTSMGGGAAYSVQEARKFVLQDALNSNAGAAIAGKEQAVIHFAPVMKANVDEALASGDVIRAKREIAKIAGKYDAAAQVAPQNAEALANGILAQGIVVSSLPSQVQALFTVPAGQNGITYQQAIEQLRGDADYQTMRREYMSSGIAAANAANAAAQLQGQPIVPIQPQQGS